MNNEYFECQVKYDKTQETGLLKPVTETYLVEALSFTEAERRFIEEMTPYISGEFTVAAAKRARVAELFESTDAAADRYFKARIAYITLDERTGAEKRTPQTVIVQSTDFRTALRDLDRAMKDTLGDWCIISIAETPIMDVFHYQPSDSKSEFEA